VPKSMIANKLNLLYICSDNLSFWGVFVQNGCIAEISNSAIFEITLRNINHKSYSERDAGTKNHESHLLAAGC
jgi:hypothetical protein